MAEKAQSQFIDLKEKIGKGKLILVLGANGMMGTRFIEQFGNGNFLTPGSDELDITDFNAVKLYMDYYSPNFIVNFAAFTDVTKAEEQRYQTDGSCWKVNVEGVNNIIKAINPEKTHLIQISTNMVGDGTGELVESSLPETDLEKMTWYGYTKAVAERHIINRLGLKNATIVRIAQAVNPFYDKKLDYLRKPIMLYKDLKLPSQFIDQRVSITLAEDLNQALAKIIEDRHKGIFHVSSTDSASPYDITSELLERVMNRAVWLSISTRNSFDQRRYPRIVSLSVENTEKVLDMRFSRIHEIIELVAELH